jgi:transposase
MGRKAVSVARIEEIRRLISEGQTDRFIARALKCRRSRVAEIRKLPEIPTVGLVIPSPGPAWWDAVDWVGVLEEIGRGFELKRVWEDKAQSYTSYSNFWKQLYRKYPHLLKATVTLRDFKPGAHCEVDYAGDRIDWIDSKGEIHEAHIFLGILCYSQRIFAWASEDEKSQNWLIAHQKMYAHFGGVPSVTVCDCLKTGVTKAHRYDPDLNPAYSEMATHYATALVPARPLHPKDKALIENAVGLVCRLFRWTYRRHTFFSLLEVNRALSQTVERINLKPHSRFKTSRQERWEKDEKSALKCLPELPFEMIEWSTARVHPDSTIAVESAMYSVPHPHRGKQVRVKLTAHQVEIFLENERLAIHPRDRSKAGMRVINNDHLPQNSQAYRETTPQMILSQAKFIHADLNSLIDDLFQLDTLGNLRRAQGLVRKAHIEIQTSGRESGSLWISEAIKRMRRFEKIRVTYFTELLTALKKQKFKETENHEIIRKPGNPMLRQTPETEHQAEFTFPVTITGE